MSSFTSPLIVELTSGGKSWIVFRRFTYRIGKKYSRRFISIPTGFLTDFASIPKFILPFLPDWAKFNKSSPLHDYLYRKKTISIRLSVHKKVDDEFYRTRRRVAEETITRKEADDIWLEAMLIDFRNHKSGKLVALLEYWAVRMFAWIAWR